MQVEGGSWVQVVGGSGTVGVGEWGRWGQEGEGGWEVYFVLQWREEEDCGQSQVLVFG